MVQIQSYFLFCVRTVLRKQKLTWMSLSSAVCQQVGDPVLAQYYQAVAVDGIYVCLTACSPRHSSPRICFNKGICRVYLGTGPVCE